MMIMRCRIVAITFRFSCRASGVPLDLATELGSKRTPRSTAGEGSIFEREYQSARGYASGEQTSVCRSNFERFASVVERAEYHSISQLSLDQKERLDQLQA